MLIIVGLGAIQFLVSILIKTRIEESIRGEYGGFLEKFKYDLRVREQAAKVAELFAEVQLHWGDSKLTPEKARKINRSAWELSLWLPADSARELMRNLRWAQERKPMQEILVDIRKHLLMDPKDGLEPEEIVCFEAEKGS